MNALLFASDMNATHITGNKTDPSRVWQLVFFVCISSGGNSRTHTPTLRQHLLRYANNQSNSWNVRDGVLLDGLLIIFMIILLEMGGRVCR